MKFDIGIRHTNEKVLSDIVAVATYLNEIHMSRETAGDLFSTTMTQHDGYACVYKGIPIKFDDSIPYGIVDLT